MIRGPRLSNTQALCADFAGTGATGRVLVRCFVCSPAQLELQKAKGGFMTGLARVPGGGCEVHVVLLSVGVLPFVWLVHRSELLLVSVGFEGMCEVRYKNRRFRNEYE